MGRDLFFWILIGLVAGTVARLAFPAREAGGFILSLLLGIAGALAGGFLALQMSGGVPSIDASMLAAGAGSVGLLLLYRVVIRARGR